ncbi:MAG: amino acid adenylation domain-containing protein [Actinophytocola sp.]|uniref:non-ribosomal peptide synthetase n=1 Tax=Actinophytocola sp. TaxID=1872138 RepID=UPI003C771D27
MTVHHEETTALPLSFAQRRMWFLQWLSAPPSTYNLPVVLRLTGPVDRRALQTALTDVVARHEPLRTVFPDLDGEPVQHVLPRSAELTPLVMAPEPVLGLDRALRDAASAPFDLGTGVPLRATLFAQDDREAVLLLVLHHIAADGWSMAPFLGDLASAYRARAGGAAPTWSELPVQYADYVWWQQDLLGDPADPDSLFTRQATFWRRTLAGLPEVVTIPADHQRPSVASHRGAAVPVRWDRRTHAALGELGRAHGCTEFMVLHAALAVVLARLGGGTDIPVGTPVAGRTEDDLDGLVGLFVNTLVLRTDLSGDPSFREVLRRVRRSDAAAFDNQELPFDALVESLDLPRSLSHHPLFQVMLAFETSDDAVPDFGATTAARVPLDLPVAKVDLTLQLTGHRGGHGEPEGIDGYLEYATDLFDEHTATALLARLGRLLDLVVANQDLPISRLDLLSDRERHQVLTGWNDTSERLPVSTLHAEFERQVERTPHATALVAGDRSVSYAELGDRTADLASRLGELGIRPGDVVGVALPRSADLVVSLLAVLRAGAAYLPLDPDLPAARLSHMVRDARPRCVLTDRVTRDVLPPGTNAVVDLDGRALRGDHPAGRPTPHHPAYVIYTSGSTGTPKGVVVAHSAIDNRLRWMQDAYPLGLGDRVLHKTPTGFDVSVWELFWPLRVGATLVLADPGEHQDPRRLARTIERHGITVMHFVPSMLRPFLAEVVDFPAVTPRLVVCSGEELPRDTADEFHRVLPGTRLENLYGPTEAAVDVTAYGCAPGGHGPVPIGRPVWNTRVLVLDAGLGPCPVGVPGELYLAGAQLADGYLGRAGLTASRFVACPYGAAGERMYRTGDVVRWRATGMLEFLGRADQQVKIRGQRVELGEVESALLAVDGVAAAGAVVRDDGAGRTLVAYVAPVAGRPLDPAALRQGLADRLPGAMVPAVVTVLDALPLGPNGKLDRAALPAPHLAASGGRRPDTPLERRLAALFEEVLDVPGIGLDDDFFALGGHSLLVVRLVRRMRADLGAELPVQEVFRGPTVAALARRLMTGGAFPDDHPALLTLRSGGGGPPLFFLPPAAGLSWCYLRVLPYVDSDRPVYGLQTRPGGPARSVDELAAEFLVEIRRVQPRGPYDLAGWSFGGHVAHAAAVRLRAEGERVRGLVVFDSYPNTLGETPPAGAELLAVALTDLVGRPDAWPDGTGDPNHLPTNVLDRVRTDFAPLADADDDEIRAHLRMVMENVRMQARFSPGTHDGDLTVVVAGRGQPADARWADAWGAFVSGRLTVHTVDTGHHQMFDTASAATGAALAAALRGTVQPAAGSEEEQP